MARSSAADIELTVGLEAGDVANTAEYLRERIAGIFDANAGKPMTTAFASLQASMANVYQSSSNLQNRLTALKNSTIPTEAYTELQKKIEEVGERLSQLRKEKEKFESAGFSEAQIPDSFKADLEEAEQQFKNLNEEKQRLENTGEAFVPGTATQEYENLTQKLAGANNQMSVLLRRSEDIGKFPPPTTRWEAFGRILSKVATEALKMTKTLATVMIVKPLEMAASAAKKLASELGRVAASSIKTGINGLARSVFGIKKSSDSTNDSIKKGIKLFIRYAFGVRSFFFLYRKIRRAISEGFGDMAQASAPLNNQLSQLATSMLYLRNAVTSAFAPIASFVIPILTTLINVLAAAANAVGQFMAALFGQTSFVKAKKVYKDYAASLDKSAAKQQENASKTQKKVDKLQKTIAGFDDVNILQGKDDDDTSPSGGGGGGGAGGVAPWEDPNNMFETTSIEAKYKELADKIKSFFKKEDWEGLGKFIADGINAGFEAIDKVLTSTKVQERVSKIITAITETFNSLVDNIDWELIGKTFGDGINLIIDSLNQLYTGIDWQNLGVKISTGLNSLITTVDWLALGTLFANKFNSLIHFVFGAVTTFDWANAGQAIGNAINGFFLNVDWDSLALTLVNLFKGIFTGLQNVIETVEWEKIGNKLKNALNILINSVDWNKLRTDFMTALNNTLSVAVEVIDKIDWKGAGKKLGSSLSTMINGVNWAKLAQLLSSAFIGALSALSGAMATFDWVGLGNSIGIFLANVDWGGIFLKVIQVAIQALVALVSTVFGLLVGFFKTIIDKIANYLEDKSAGDIVKGLFNGIVNALKGIGKWIVNNIFNPFINGFKKAFGIGSPSKKMKEQGGFIISGLLKGIGDGLKNIGSWIKSHVFDKVKGAFTTAFNVVGGVANKIISFGSSIMGGLKKGIGDKWKDVKDKVKELPGKIKDAYNNSVGKKFIDFGTKIGKEINEGIKDKWKDVKDKVSELPGKIKDAFNNVKGSKFWSLGSGIVSGIKSGISDMWSSVSDWFGKKVGGLIDVGKKALGINSPSKLFRDIVGKSIPQGIAVGIDKDAYKAVDSVEGLANDLTSAATQSISLPPIVGGKIIPYSIGKSDAEDTNNTLNQVLDMLQYSKDNSISIDELQSLLIDMFRRYLNIQFYMEDEQVARHANAGNLKLNRRYNTT